MSRGLTKQWHNKPYPSIDPTRPELNASGKNVIITGGGSGIGRAMALAFATAKASSITLIGRRPELLQETAAELEAQSPSTTIICEAVDITDRGGVESALDRVVSSVGKLSILCCNAGVVPQAADFLEITSEQVRYACDVNVWGAINMVQCFQPRSTGGGMVINTSSALAHTSPIAKMAVYSISKIANLKAMEYLAAENPALYIVNMHPGVVETEPHRHRAGIPNAPKIDYDHPSLPGNLTVWLASPEAAFLRGRMVWANWNVDELMARSGEIEKEGLLSLINGLA